MKRLLPIILIFFLFNSCFDQNDCLITSTNLCKIDLATIAGVAQSLSFYTVQQDSLGPDHNQVVEFSYWEGPSISSLQLPLDPERDTSYYSFLTQNDSVRYKLAVRYTTYSRVISTDCGAFLYFNNLAVIKSGASCVKTGVGCYTTFDSTRVVQPQLFQSVTTNIRLFF